MFIFVTTDRLFRNLGQEISKLINRSIYFLVVTFAVMVLIFLDTTEFDIQFDIFSPKLSLPNWITN